MRNALPQIIFAGHPDLAAELFDSWQPSEYQHEPPYVHGSYLGRLLAKCNTAAPDKIAKIIQRYQYTIQANLLLYMYAFIHVVIIEFISGFSARVATENSGRFS